MSKIDGSYNPSSFLSDIIQKKQKGVEEAKSPKTKAAGQAEKTAQIGLTGQTKLSAKAQKLLEKLKADHKDMDFMVADFGSSDEAKDILSRGTKEYSVLFTTEELEKMASDEKYEQECMDKVQGAINMVNKVNEQFGSDPDKGELASVGISFNSDGTTTLFATLEKSAEQQKNRIEETREKNAEAKKAEAKKAEEKKAEAKKDVPTKKVTVQASDEKELLEKLNSVDWSKVTDRKKAEGDKFDFTV